MAVVKEGEVHVGQGFNAAGQGVRLGDALAGKRPDVGHGKSLGLRPLLYVQLCQMTPAQRGRGLLIVA